jgi:hypothetical protein
MVVHHRAAKLWVLLLFVFLLSAGTAQTKPARSTHTPVVTLPRGASDALDKVTRIPSPDRRWTLIFEFRDVYKPRKLWIQRKGSNERTLVRDFDRSLDVSWSPDSRHFFVNNASGSTETLCYVYDPSTLKVTDVAEVLAKVVPKAAEYLGANHSYLEAKRWINSHRLIVTLEANFDESPPTTPGFSGTYRVDLDGSVRKVHERYWR